MQTLLLFVYMYVYIVRGNTVYINKRKEEKGKKAKKWYIYIYICVLTAWPRSNWRQKGEEKKSLFFYIYDVPFFFNSIPLFFFFAIFFFSFLFFTLFFHLFPLSATTTSINYFFSQLDSFNQSINNNKKHHSGKYFWIQHIIYFSFFSFLLKVTCLFYIFLYIIIVVRDILQYLGKKVFLEQEFLGFLFTKKGGERGASLVKKKKKEKIRL